MARTPTESSPPKTETDDARQTETDDARCQTETDDARQTQTDDVITGPRPTRSAHPRLIEEHYEVGPRGEQELEATDELGRRWYHLRPQPRGSYDMIGFNWTWWLIWIFVLFVIFLPWGNGWGW